MMKAHRFVNLVAVVLLAGLLAVAFPGLSSAVFSAKTQNTATVTAANDWTPPTVSLTAPTAAFVRGTVPVTATASDARSGIAKVVLDRLPAIPAAGAPWTELCAPVAAPYSCAWNTTTVADGEYSLRATAHDRAGYTAAATTRTTVDNTAPTVTMVDPGATITGTRTFSANASDATSGVAKVVFQYAATGSGAFQDLCTATASPWSCSVATSTLTDGRYDFRAVATDKAGNPANSNQFTNRPLDNGPALAGLDVQTSNGGGTPGQVDAGDSITFTFNRQVNLSTILTGWDGSPRSVQSKFGIGFFTNDKFEVANVHLGEVNLVQDYVWLPFSLSSTMTARTETVNGQLRTVVTVVFDETPSSALVSGVVTRGTNMVWSPSDLVRDLLNRSSSAASVNESGPLDREF